MKLNVYVIILLVILKINYIKLVDIIEKDLENNTKPKKRRQSISIQRDFIDCVDKHILDNITNIDFSPASGYDSFCSNHKDFIENESNRLIELNIDNKIIIEKIKKLYKNRYNIIIKIIMLLK